MKEMKERVRRKQRRKEDQKEKKLFINRRGRNLVDLFYGLLTFGSLSEAKKHFFFRLKEFRWNNYLLIHVLIIFS